MNVGQRTYLSGLRALFIVCISARIRESNQLDRELARINSTVGLLAAISTRGVCNKGINQLSFLFKRIIQMAPMHRARQMDISHVMVFYAYISPQRDVYEGPMYTRPVQLSTRLHFS